MTKTFSPGVRRSFFVATVVSIALLSGHLVQQSGSDLGTAVQPLPDVTVPSLPREAGVLQPPPLFPDRTLETRAERLDSCDPELQVSETPSGHIHVALLAPCYASSPIKIQFNDLVADDTTDATGFWEARLPPLGERTHISVNVDRYLLQDTFVLDTLIDQRLVILAWDGSQTFRIKTDVPVAERSDANALISRLGDGSGASLEVMSFPKNGASGTVRLSVEAEVTRANCDRTIKTVAFQTGYLGALRKTDIEYTMPDCDRVGDVVLLQNLFRDMTLARR